jgi:hypothetical protein
MCDRFLRDNLGRRRDYKGAEATNVVQYCLLLLLVINVAAGHASFGPLT